jgi:primosomal protein N' (replication factor Y)
MDPSAASIAAAARHDADGFLEGELERRRALRYPPFSSLIKVVCSAVDPGEAHAAAEAVRDRLDLAPGVVLGPAPLFRLRGRERAQLVLKAAPEQRAEAIEHVGAAVEMAAAAKEHRAAAFSVDVDPQ